MKKRFFILLGLLIAAGAAYYFFSSNSKQETTYLTESVTRGNVEKTVVASGSVESVNEVDVGAQASGKITKLYVKLGQEIKKGGMIADIDSTTQINTLNTKKRRKLLMMLPFQVITAYQNFIRKNRRL